MVELSSVKDEFVKFLCDVIEHHEKGDLEDFIKKLRRDELLYHSPISRLTAHLIPGITIGWAVYDEFDIRFVEVVRDVYARNLNREVQKNYEDLLEVVTSFEIDNETSFRRIELLEKLKIGHREGNRTILDDPTRLLFLLWSFRPGKPTIVKYIPAEVALRELRKKDKKFTAITGALVYYKIFYYISFTDHFYYYSDIETLKQYSNPELKKIKTRNAAKIPRTFYIYRPFRILENFEKTPLSLIFIDSKYDCYSSYVAFQFVARKLNERGFDLKILPKERFEG